MKSIVRESDTIDDAVKVALDDLGAEINEVEIEILRKPSRGLLGLIGNKDAKVKVTVKDGPKEKADIFMKNVLEKMKIECEYEIEYINNLLKVNINKIDDSEKGIIIGKRGKNLDAFQFIMNLIVNKGRENYVRTVLDVEDYRQRREETLKRLANKMAEKCKYYNNKVKLEPMNPYERRIIHSSLQNDDEIITYSEGEEPFRRVIIDKK